MLHPPVMGAHLLSMDYNEALTMPGVIEVVIGKDFVGLVAERHEQAQAAVAALKVEWTLP